jgi:hypothetical protein
MKNKRQDLAKKDGPPRSSISADRRGGTRHLMKTTFVGALSVVMSTFTLASVTTTPASAAPVGAGFVLDRGDLEFILKQIKISERHVATATPANACGTLLGTAPDQIPNDGPNGEVLPWGLRTVDGT